MIRPSTSSGRAGPDLRAGLLALAIALQHDIAPAGNGRDATTSTTADGPRDDAIVPA